MTRAKKSLGLARRSFMWRLGQNFLKDPKILRKIAEAAKITGEDTVLEIGPGEGTLTELLLERARKVIAVEKDRKLVEHLNKKFKKEIEEEKLEVIKEDVLKLKLEESPECETFAGRRAENRKNSAEFYPCRADRSFLQADNYILVGNIPYYITGAIFKKFLESENQPRSITFVVQKEVAERIMARNGKESVLSVSIKSFSTPEYGGIIKAGSFTPKPKVDSAIISIRDINIERLKGLKIEKFFEIVKKGFAHKRKFLVRNLEILAGKGEILRIFQKCGIPEKARAEDLLVRDWICLTKNLI